MKPASKINASWHQQHPMPKNPTIEQRITWHVEHLKHCQCRNEIPAKLQLEMKKRGMHLPSVNNAKAGAHL